MADPLRQTYGEVFFLTSGLQRDPYGLANFHPASNVNRLDIYLEDGVSTNVVMVNFKADGKGYPTSVFFPTLYGGTVQKVITGEASARSFAKYSLLVPPQVLQWNANGTSTLSLQTTVVQTAGDGLLGAFENYTALTTAHPATEVLMDAGSIAYVYTTVGSDEYGFYAVTYDSVAATYSWTLVNNPVTQINMVDTKQYNIVGMQIQKGNLPRPTSTVTISDEYIRYILAYISTVNDNCNLNKQTLDDHEIRITALETDVDAIIAGTQDITFNNTISGLVATTLKGAVDEVAIAISNMKDGTDAFTKLTLTDGAGGTAEFYYDGTDPILKYRNITGELLKNLFLEVEPASGVTFTNGMQVMYAGSIGASGKRLAKPTVLSELQVLPGLYLGAITEVTTEGHGIVNWYGNVNGLDTSGMTLGAVVYVGDSGAWTTTKPVSPLPQIPIGLIERVSPAEGRISVRPDIGRNLGGLHDVYLNGHTFVGGETIMYNIANNRYEVYDLGGKITTIEGRITAIEDNKAIDFSVINDVKYPTTKAVKDYVDTRQTTIYDFKGSVLFANLPTTGQKVGDTYNITDNFTLGGEDYLAGTNVAWNGTSWDALGSHIPIASEIDYNNGDSTLVAVNVKTALDELDDKAETNASNITDLDNRVTANENDIDALQDKDVLHDSRINQIEEQLRTSFSDEDTATKSGTDIISMGNNVANAPLNVLVEGGLLDAPQLITNGDFSGGTTGWVQNDTTGWAVSNGISSFTATAQFGRVSKTLTLLNSTKYYACSLVKATSTSVQLNVYLNGPTYTTILTANAIANGNYNLLSGTFTTTQTANGIRIIDTRTSGWDLVSTDYSYLFNISTLIANKQYSPLYDTTFDLMSDANIKAQMDTWVLNGTLPNSIMAVNMDKRIRSVGKNLFNGELEQGIILTSTGQNSSATDSVRTPNYIRVIPSTNYMCSTGLSDATTITFFYYDINKNYISSSSAVANTNTVTTPSNCYYIRFRFYKGSAVVTPQLFTQPQLELGTVATNYRSYTKTDLYLQSGKVGYRLPNGVRDTIEFK